MRKCEGCGGSMAGKHGSAKSCSDACRVRAYRRKLKAKADGKPDPGPTAAAQAAAPVAPAETMQAPAGGITKATRDKLAPLGRDDDPMAVYLLNLATLLDNPAELAGGALSSIGKEFRATYAAFFDEHGEPEGDAADQARDEVAAKRAQLAAMRAAK